RHEQVSLVIRHADDQFHVYERFIGFQRASSTTGEALFKLLVMWLKQLDLDINNIVGQCFDGASAMSSGVTRGGHGRAPPYHRQPLPYHPEKI
ncbi:unnamed protein product, partial [Rotaria socialis]